MAIKLEKGHRINLEKDSARLEDFCVGCNWGAIAVHKPGFLGFGGKTELTDVDLDLSVLMLDEQGNMVDYIYSPEYRRDFLSHYGMGPGKLDSADGALHHSGDDRRGDQGEDDGLDNEIVVVSLPRVSPRVSQIFFFLNNVGKEDFSQIPYASIRMYEGTPTNVKEVFASYDVAAAPNCYGKRALIMGKLYKRDNTWRFMAIGDAVEDNNICETINRIVKQYA